jgi:hypothetical protein
VQLDPEALAESTRVYFEDLRPLALGDEFTAFLMEIALDYRALEAASPEYRAYAEAYIDLHRLIEEIRFEAALAVLLLVEYRAKRDRGEAPRVTETIEFRWRRPR